MRKKKPHIATLEQIRIRRKGEYALIEYKDLSISGVNLKIGGGINEKTDREILDLINATLQTQQNLADKLEYVAVEIPIGKPQIECSKETARLVPRGDVLRCVIDDAEPEGEPTAWIDDQELSLEEFGDLLRPFVGWGMRITFVPEDEIDRPPVLEVSDRSDGNAG